jgi:hypothetical protein
MNVRIDLNEPRILEKVQGDRFGLLVSNEWKRLIDPYTPRDTGTMQDTAVLGAFNIHYKTPYATRIYYGKGYNFQKKNPYSTYEWDIKASVSGQLNKLYRILNNALQSGQF